MKYLKAISNDKELDENATSAKISQVRTEGNRTIERQIGLLMRNMDRKKFIKKACFAGVCFCGFSSISTLANNDTSTIQENNKQLNQDLLANFLTNLDQDLEPEVLRDIVKKSSFVHYNNLKMDKMLSEYIGDLEKFIKYIESAWGWKIDYNKTTKVLIADENKDYCVCPILEHKKGINTSAICYCSEGFAEKMFSVVTETTVKAKVISSVRKGDKSCIYRIEIT